MVSLTGAKCCGISQGRHNPSAEALHTSHLVLCLRFQRCQTSRFLLLSALSVGLSVFVLATTDWLEQTDQAAIVARNYYLNLFVHFYAEPLRTNVGLIAPEALFTCLIPTTTLILNEGYRRRRSFPLAPLALFVGLSLAFGAGTTTPFISLVLSRE